MKKVATTRTLNPLPFQDLEPHRFEDLIRQLAYDLRRWRSLEATGRSGSDEGLDIRGLEIVPVSLELEEEEETPSFEERLWVFQCKREKSLASKKVHEVVRESLASLAVPPHGFVLAVASDVSKRTRDTFREEMVARGIEEFAIWAKGELEDMLFQPRNDRLLFAYFGLSLQPRRRSLTSTLRSEIAMKKQLAALLGEETDDGKVVLLRDPTDERYPDEPKAGEPPARWFACHAITIKKPGHLVVLRHGHLAATTPGGEHWDAIFSYDTQEAIIASELLGVDAWSVRDRDRLNSAAGEFWNEHIAQQDKAYLKLYRSLPIDRILAVDPLGDGYFPIPHMLVDFDSLNGPFGADKFDFLEHPVGGRLELKPEQSNRVEIFPNPLPTDLELPPKAFDQTAEEAVPLSDAATDKLAALLATVAEQRQGMQVAQGSDDARLPDDKMVPFREWRDRVALPVFSAFVHRLRDEGHAARVVIRSPEGRHHQQPRVESIGLRVQLHVGSPHNPNYRPSGHLEVSMAEFTGWQVDVFPPSESRGSYSRAISEAPEKAQLEEQVLSMLQRLHSRGY